METMEIVVYIAIAFIVGTLIIAFIGGWDTQATFNSLRRVFQPDRTAHAETTSGELAKVVLETWEECGMGTSALNRTVYVTDAAPLDKTLIFDKVKQLRLCRTLQWDAAGCGTRDDIAFSGATGPAVLVLRCDPATRTLIIS